MSPALQLKRRRYSKDSRHRTTFPAKGWAPIDRFRARLLRGGTALAAGRDVIVAAAGKTIALLTEIVRRMWIEMNPWGWNWSCCGSCGCKSLFICR
jgi:hypothetical protein